jgi:hypothetical protein
MGLPGWLTGEVAPLLAALVKVNEQIAWCDAAVEHATTDDPEVALLRTTPRIGPVTAASFRAAIDDVKRFHGPHQVAAYLGLVPREKSSGEKQHRGRITRAGDSRTRSLLVQASQRLRYGKIPETLGLRMWAKRIEARRGKAGGDGGVGAQARRDPLRDAPRREAVRPRHADRGARHEGGVGDRPGLANRAVGFEGSSLGELSA